MVYISMVQGHASNRPKMVEANVWALGGEEQVPSNGFTTGVRGNRDHERWG